MKKSALQQARSAYQPKLPQVLKGAVKVVEGRRKSKNFSLTLTVSPSLLLKLRRVALKVSLLM